MTRSVAARMGLLAVLASGLGACGGGDGKTWVRIELRAGNVAVPVHRIEVDFDLAGRPAMITLAEPGDTAIALPTSTVVEVASGSGQLYIAATARGAGGAMVGHGSVWADVVRGQTARVVIEFGVEVTPPVDGGTDAPATPALSIDPVTRDFGNVVVGQRSAPVTFTVRNGGGLDTPALQVSLGGQSPAAFALGARSCTGALPPGQTCTVEVSFAPTAAGATSAELVVSGGAGLMVRAPLDGTAVPAGDLAISPTSQDFTSVVLGSASSPVSFTVTNNGSAATGLLTTQLGGSDSTQFAVVADSCVGNTLAPAATCAIMARFAPTRAGSKQASLTVQASPGGAAVANLVGAAQAPASLTLSPPSVDFGAVVLPGMSTAQTFTVQNTGGVASTMLATALSGADAAQFMLSSDGCAGTMVGPGASCTVAVVFKPSAAGTRSASLTVTPTGQSALTASLSGLGQVAASITAQPATLAFGSVLTSTTQSAALTLSNPGGLSTGNLAVTLGGSDAAQFSLVSDGCTGQRLAPGGSCALMIGFTPLSAGAKSANLAVTATPGGPLSVPVSGTGLTQGALTATPASASFADTLVGQSTPTQTITVSNSGGSATGNLTTMLLGAGAGAFAITANTCTGMALAPTTSCTVTVRFSPMSAGNLAAQLEVAGTPGGVIATSLSGRGLAPARLTLAPSTRDFGTVVVGAMGPSQVFTVSNDGEVPSGAPSAALSGAQPGDFVVSDSTCTGALAPGASCALTVRFDPAAGGARAASLTVSATPGGMATATLTGAGTTPAALALTPSPLAFGTRLVGSSTTLDVTVTNSGQQPSGALAAPSTSDAAQFAIVAPTGGTPCTVGAVLAQGGSCRFGVRFTPGASGARSATIGVSATPGGSPSVMATGTGQRPAQLDLTPAAWGFGGVDLGMSATQAFTVTNTGEQAAGMLVGPSSSDGRFTTLPPGGATTNCAGLAALAGGASCGFLVRFTPAAVGNYMGTITVSAAPGGSDSATVTGSGQSGASLGAAPASIAFGDVDVGASSAVTDVVLSNNGASATGNIAMPVPTPATFSVVAPGLGPACTWGAPLAGNASCRFGVRFQPSASGSAVGSLALSASPGGSASVALSGVGQLPPRLDVSPASFDFGLNYVNAGGNFQFQIRNTGTRQSDGLAFSIVGTYYDILTVGGDCSAGQTLAGGASCSMHVKFAPTQRVTDAPGTFTASITGSSDTLQLSGDAIVPGSIGHTGGAFDWGVVHVGESSGTKVVTFTNDGDEPVTGVTYQTSPSGEFAPVAGGTCGTTLAPMSSCTQLYAVTPAAGGLRTAYLSAYGNSAYYGVVSAGVQGYATGGYLHSVSRTPPASLGYVETIWDSTSLPCMSSSCSYLFASGTSLIMLGRSVAPCSFIFWASGPCAGSSGQCSYTLNTDTSTNAQFTCP